MDTPTAVVGTGVVVAVGHWAKDEIISIRVFVGLGVYAIGLALLGATNAQFAGQIATLVLVAAFMAYMIPIAKALGVTK